MKKFKRILIATLAIALIASAFAVSSFAEDDNREYPYTIKEFDKAEQILEYYTLEDYLADNYDDGKLSEEFASVGRGGKYEIVADPTASANNVLSVQLAKPNSDFRYSMKVLPEEALTDKIVVSSRVYFGDNADDGLTYNLRIGMQAETDPAPRYFNLFTIDMAAAEFRHYVSDGSHTNATTMQAVYNGWKPEAKTWYDIFVVYNCVDDYYKITISSVPADGSDAKVLAETGNIEIVGAASMCEYQLYVSALDSADKRKVKNFYFDNVEIYEGTTYRNPSLKDPKTRTHIEDLTKFYADKNTTFEEKLRIADIYYFFYSLDPSEFDETVLTDFPVTAVQMNETIAQEIINRVNNIDDELPYGERVAYIDYINEYSDRLPENLTDANVKVAGITEDLAKAVEEARNVRDVAIVAIEKTREHSENFIDFMTNVYDANNKNYSQNKVWYAELHDKYDGSELYKNDFLDIDKNAYPYQTRYYTSLDPACKDLVSAGHNVEIDTQYKNIPDFYADYLAFCKKFEEIENNIKMFSIHVDSMELATTFGARYDAYVQAKSYYNDGVIHTGLDNFTHAELQRRIEFYLRTEPSIIVKMNDCEMFIAIVKEAQVASYYTVLNEKLNQAEVAYYGIALDYTGMFETVALYNELLLYRTSLEIAAEDYIEAVNAIADAKNLFYAKKEAVEYARSFKESGDVLGYPGVAEANVTFAEAEADVNFREGNSTTLITLVDKIADTDSISERRILLRQAMTAKENCEITYEGVVDAKIALDKEMTRFVNDVRAANAVISSANDSAAAIAGAVSGVQIFN